MKIYSIFYTVNNYKVREAYLLSHLHNIGFDGVINYNNQGGNINGKE